MPKPFTVIYPDHSKGNISASEREHMLLAGEIQTIDNRTYKFIGKPVVLHSFLELGTFFERRAAAPAFDGFYPGLFIWELGEKRSRELLESPAAMALRLENAHGQL